MAILEAASEAPAKLEQPAAAYPARKSRGAKTAEPKMHGRKLTLADLWDLSKSLGPPSKRESTAIIRKMRDERHGR